MTAPLSGLTQDAPVVSVKTGDGALRVGFAGRYHLWLGGRWRVEALETSAPQSIGVLIGQSLLSMNTQAVELAFVFSRHRIVIAAPRRDQAGQGGDAAEPLAILYEADYPAIVW
jgi:hypothetical protein